MAEMYATLVGSRKLSSGAPKVIHMAGFMISSKGFHGRSGYAEGADCKFDRGYKIYEEASHTEAPSPSHFFCADHRTFLMNS